MLIHIMIPVMDILIFITKSLIIRLRYLVHRHIVRILIIILDLIIICWLLIIIMLINIITDGS